jgi:hypothetical protein
VTLDELEATVRRELSAAAHSGMFGDLTSRMNATTDRILAAAGDYAVTHAIRLVDDKVFRSDAEAARRRADLDNAVTGYRRTVAPVVHLYAGDHVAACRSWKMRAPVLTELHGDVTCGACRRTRAWKDAA